VTAQAPAGPGEPPRPAGAAASVIGAEFDGPPGDVAGARDAGASGPGGAGAPDWRRPFFAVWVGQALSLLGSQLVQFALIWHLTVTTGSATTLAMASLAGLLPQVLLSPLIGTWVDRGDRRRFMLAADGTVAAATLVLAGLFAAGAVEIWHIYVLLAVRAVAGGFHSSAFGASVVLMVPVQHLSRIQGLTQALRGGLDIVAAPLGALLIATVPMAAILAVDVLTALCAMVPLLFVRIPRPTRTAAPATFLADMAGGLRYVLAWRGLMVVLGMVMAINFLFTPASALLPLLVREHFGRGAAGFALLSAVASAGTLGGGVLLGVWGGLRSRIATALAALVGLGLAMLVVGLLPPSGFTAALVAMAVAGVLSPIVNGSFGATLQAAIAPEMQGRVFAFILSAASAMSPLGLILAGPLADAFGPQLPFLVGGAVCAVLGAVGFGLPAVMGLESVAADA